MDECKPLTNGNASAHPLESCDKCKKKFVSLTNLQRHKGTHARKGTVRRCSLTPC